MKLRSTDSGWVPPGARLTDSQADGCGCGGGDGGSCGCKLPDPVLPPGAVYRTGSKALLCKCGRNGCSSCSSERGGVGSGRAFGMPGATGFSPGGGPASFDPFFLPINNYLPPGAAPAPTPGSGGGGGGGCGPGGCGTAGLQLGQGGGGGGPRPPAPGRRPAGSGPTGPTGPLGSLGSGSKATGGITARRIQSLAGPSGPMGPAGLSAFGEQEPGYVDLVGEEGSSYLRPHRSPMRGMSHESAAPSSRVAVQMRAERNVLCQLYALMYMNVIDYKLAPLGPGGLPSSKMHERVEELVGELRQDFVDELRFLGQLREGESLASRMPNGPNRFQQGLLWGLKKRLMKKKFDIEEPEIVQRYVLGHKAGSMPPHDAAWSPLGVKFGCPVCKREPIILYLRIWREERKVRKVQSVFYARHMYDRDRVRPMEAPDLLHVVTCIADCLRPGWPIPGLPELCYVRDTELTCWDHPEQGGGVYSLTLSSGSGEAYGTLTTEVNGAPHTVPIVAMADAAIRSARAKTIGK
jgi:hypothetical protein